MPLAAAALALGSGVLGIARPSYWFDEAASISVATRPLPEQLRVAEHIDAVHALYNALLSSWVSLFGMTEFATRSLSLLAFALAAFGFTWFLLRLRGPRVAGFGALLFLLLPGIAWSAGEARGYALSLACSVWALVVLEAVLSRRGVLAKRGTAALAWVLYAALLLAAFAFSLLTAFIVLGHVLLVWIVRRQALPAFLASWFLAVGAALPLVLRAAQQTAQVDWIDHSLINVASKVALGQLFWGPRYNEGMSLALVAAVCLMLICGSIAVFAVVRVAVRRLPADDPSPSTLTPQQSAWFGLVLFGGPTLLLAAVTVAGFSLYQERYLLFAAPGFCLLVAEGLAALKTKAWLTWLLVAAIVVSCVPQLVAARGELSKAGDNYRGLAAAADGSDSVYIVDPSARGIFIAYPDVAPGDDVLLAETPLRSGTLWGDNIALNLTDTAVPGGTVSVITAAADTSRSVASWLTDHGCTELPTAVNSNRFSISKFDCAGSSA